MAQRRFVISLFLAVLLHLIILLVLQAVVKSEKDRIPQYSGPLFVNLEEVPVISKTLVEPVKEKPEKRREPEAKKPVPQEKAQDEKFQGEIPKVPVAEPLQPISKARPYIEKEPVQPRYKESWDRPLPKEEDSVFQPPSITEKDEIPAEPVLIPLDSLDSALSRRDKSSGDEKNGGTEHEPGDSSEDIDADAADEGLFIQWEEPSEGREPTSTPLPVIPSWVGKQGLRLKVVVSFLLTPQGYLTNVEVVESSGYSDVDTVVLEALRRWIFKPVKSLKNVRGRIPYSILPE